MHIEDQVQTKRCGHLLGKQVVSREEFLTRVRAAVIARDSIPGGSDFVGLPLRQLVFQLTAQKLGHYCANRLCSGSWYG